MYIKIVFGLLSFVSLSSAAQAGYLVLESKLSDEQRVAIETKFVNPYLKERKSNGNGGLWCGVRYPHLRVPKEMSYKTFIAFNIDEESASMIAEEYKNSAIELNIKEIKTSPFVNGMDLCYQTVSVRSNNPNAKDAEYDPNIISSDKKEARYRDLEVYAVSNPDNLISLKNNVVAKLGSQIDGLRDKCETFGHIAFGKTGYFEDINSLAFEIRDLEVMDKTIAQLSAEINLTLSFTDFTITYFDEDNNEVFSNNWSLTNN